MLIATAGHIDHGKTSLVRALTGVETDRLPEERRRGISIDLGFAYWRSDDANTIGFVDVPGHERFVRNMLAGVGGVDFALLVVAADDGVMPQTVEHAQIIDLLGVAHGSVAITKCDRVPPERVYAVRVEVQALLARTSLAGAPMFDVSSVTGRGIPELGRALRDAARTQPARSPSGRNFRLGVDRAFSITGTGTVVTGTVFDGAIELGARLVISPLGMETRVRGLQSAGKPVERVQAGERCAVNLPVELTEVRRGDWLLVPRMHAPSTRLEARVFVSHDRADSLKHDASVRLHIGASDVSARVLAPRQSAIQPGGQAVVQLVLERPCCAVVGDRFVLRERSGRHTIGGGRIVDPLSPARLWRKADRAEISAALEAGGAAQALEALLAIPGHEVEALQFERRFNLDPDAARLLYGRLGATLLSGETALLVPTSRVSALCQEIVDALRRSHQADPEAEGVPAHELRSVLRTPTSQAAFVALVRICREGKLIEMTGSFIRLPGHVAWVSPADVALWRQVLFGIEGRGLMPFTVTELARDLRTSEVAIKSLLQRRGKRRDVWHMGGERFLLREQVAELARRAATLQGGIAGKGFTAAEFRDATGIGRNTVIRILEFFDGIGVTRRFGETRRVRSDYEQTMGIEG